MRVNLKGKARAYTSLRKLIANLKEVASGEAVNEGLERFQAYLDGRIKAELSRHVRTGLALRTAEVDREPKKIDILLQKYLLRPGKSNPEHKGKKSRLFPWSFRKGTPKSALLYGQKILNEEIAKRLKAAP